ncbi:MAG TPA: PKD domain-containing protein [Armatimonadota bacterium]|jgi:hypothetical protein
MLNGFHGTTAPKIGSRCLSAWPRSIALIAALAAGLSTPAAAEFDLYRASLHAHTGYSDGAVLVPADPTVLTPGTAAAAAKAAGLTAFSTSDHGEAIPPVNWTNTMAQMTAATVPGSTTTAGTFVGLWGFEWTHCAPNAAPAPVGNPGTGHINIYGSSVRCGAASAGSGDASTAIIASVYWNRYFGSPSTKQSLYRWVLDHGQSPLGGTIVVQINHPNTYPGGTLANPTADWTTDWWRKLEWVPALDPYVCLMEMGSRAETGNGSTTGYYGGAYNEPYFQAALDNGWHLAPTNGEDNHRGAYGAARTTDGILTETGIWCAPTTGMTQIKAQAALLDALRLRRTFSAEDKASTHAGAISLQFTVTPPGKATRWMGSRDFQPDDVRRGVCRLVVTRAAGLQLSGGTVEVITNRGVVARSLPTSGSSGVRITDKTATWEFTLDGSPAPAQLRAVSTAVASRIQRRWDIAPLPAAYGAAPLTVAFDASTSGRAERYYYVRVKQSDGTFAFSAPIWLKSGAQVVGGDDGIRPPRAANVISYSWDFGDGTKQTESAAAADDGLFDGLTQHAYTALGVYYPRVTVRYADGGSDVSVTRVVVSASSPPPFYGDVNGDGQINRDDVSALSTLAAGLQPADAPTLARANVYPPAGAAASPGGTTKLDLADVMRLVRFLNGRFAAWP